MSHVLLRRCEQELKVLVRVGDAWAPGTRLASPIPRVPAGLAFRVRIPFFDRPKVDLSPGFPFWRKQSPLGLSLLWGSQKMEPCFGWCCLRSSASDALPEALPTDLRKFFQRGPFGSFHVSVGEGARNEEGETKNH